MNLNDEQVIMARKEFEGASHFAVEVGTSGQRPGNAGSGSRVVIAFEDLGATAWELEVDGRTISKPARVTLRFGGEFEGIDLIAGLDFAFEPPPRRMVVARPGWRREISNAVDRPSRLPEHFRHLGCAR